MENSITQILKETLNIEQVGIDDNFFQLGGHSLKATQLVSKIHKAFDIDIPLAELFVAPTIKELAGYLKRIGTREYKYVSIEPVSQKDYYIVSSAQKRLYFLHQLDETATAYNMPIPLATALDLDRVRRQLAACPHTGGDKLA